jgi:hypothetical protein
MKKIVALLLAVVTCIALLAGCGTDEPINGNTRTITDGAGRQVEVPEKVESIVCVGVGALRYTCYVGAQDLVIGVEDYEVKPGMSRLYNYVNFDKFKDLPVIGTNGEPYTEEIINLAPDVIVMSAYASVEADDLQSKTGTPVVVVPGSDTTLDDAAYETIRIMGELYGMENRATELTEYLKGLQKDLDSHLICTFSHTTGHSTCRTWSRSSLIRNNVVPGRLALLIELRRNKLHAHSFKPFNRISRFIDILLNKQGVTSPVSICHELAKCLFACHTHHAFSLLACLDA